MRKKWKIFLKNFIVEIKNIIQKMENILKNFIVEIKNIII